MKKLFVFSLACVMAGSAFAQDSIKEDLKDAWNATKDGVKKAGAVVEQKVDELTSKSTPDAPPVSGKIGITVDENGITMPSTLTAGATTLVVTNSGTRDHEFEFDGPGIEFTKNLKPGETNTLTTMLAPGNYKAECETARDAKQAILVK